MGIQDRDYYRNEGPSIFDQLMPRGMVCRWLIGINVAVFLLQLLTQAPTQVGDALIASNGWVTDWLILDVNAVKHGEIWRLLTYAFLHNDFWHIFFNMLFLWWFGSDVEQLYGRKEFLAIYLISAFLGGVAYEFWGLMQDVAVPCLGASGAVTTMLVLCACPFPRRVIYIFFVLPIPIWLFVIGSVGLDLYHFVGRHQTGVAVVVHLAGAAFGLAYYKWQRSVVEMMQGFKFWNSTRSRARLKIYRPERDKEEPVAVSANTELYLAVDEHLEAKLDAVLEKIAKTGKESLTIQEQEILRQAAEMYKRRRS